jgi:hypothetical protein
MDIAKMAFVLGQVFEEAHSWVKRAATAIEE